MPEIKTLAIALVVGCTAASAHADTATAFFAVPYGGAAAPGGTVTFSLNPDGSVAASLDADSLLIFGFGFDGPAQDIPQNGLPSGYFASSWNTDFGMFNDGFISTDPNAWVHQANWTIGLPGQYVSAWDAIKGPNTSYDFFMFTADDTGWTNFSQWPATATAVPEPASLWLIAIGLPLAGLLARRRRRASVPARPPEGH